MRGQLPFGIVQVKEERHSSDQKGRAPWASSDAAGLQAVLGATKNAPVLIRNKLNTESLSQAAPPHRSQPQRAGVAHASEPSALEAATANLGADEARDVIAPLAPVETRPAIDTAIIRFRRGRDTEALQQPGAAVGQLAAIVGQGHVPRGLQGIGDGDADGARDVVVASAGEA